MFLTPVIKGRLKKIEVEKKSRKKKTIPKSCRVSPRSRKGVERILSSLFNNYASIICAGIK